MAVYLDYNATAPLKPGVRAAMIGAMDQPGNPSSVHGFGRAARMALERARRQVAATINADPEDVIFTSGATEANNAALRHAPVVAVLTSAIEHEAVLAATPAARRIPVDAAGLLDLAALEIMLDEQDEPVLVSVMLANNETGVIQPIADIASVVHRHGGYLHCDAVQAFGKLPIDRVALGADMLSLSAHKCGGPAGVGALVVSERLAPERWQFGGGQEKRRRPGTENLLGIIGFGQAAELAVADMPAMQALADWRDGFEAAALAAMPQARITGAGAPRLPNTSSIGLPGVPSQTQVMALDLAGYAVSAGSACSSGRVEASNVIEAITGDRELAASVLRLSLGWQTTAADVEGFTLAWIAMAQRLLAKGAA